MNTILTNTDRIVEDFFETIADIVRPIEKIRTVSDQLCKLQLEIGTCEQRLQQLKAAEENKNWLFYSLKEKAKWYQDLGKKVDKEIAIIAQNEKKLNELIK
jgi:DNA repair exonuclease SbcCD ATPase subunit